MPWILVGIWAIGAALFVFSVWVSGLAAIRIISARRRTRRIWHGQVTALRARPLRPVSMTLVRNAPLRRGHLGCQEQGVNGGRR